MHINTFLLLQKHLTPGTKLILIGWKIVSNEEHVQCNHRFSSQPLTNEPLHSPQLFDTSLQKARGTISLCGPWTALHFLAFSGLLWSPEKARKCSEVVPRAFWRLHCVGPKLRYNFCPPKEARKYSEVVLRAFWRFVSKSCEECKGSFARGCEEKRWSHWTCSSLGTIFQPMRINSVPDVKCFCNNKSVLRTQSMVWHFVRHPV